MHFGFKVIIEKQAAESLQGKEQYTSYFSYISKSSNTNFYFYYKQNEGFERDKLFFETEEFIAGVDGITLNLEILKKEYATTQWSTLLLLLYKKYKENLPQQLAGEFAGFVFEKHSEKLIYFTNHCATKKTYYHQLKDGLIIAPSLQEISDHIISKGISPDLDKTTAYSLLTYGGMYKNKTLMQGVFRLHGGELLSVKRHHLQLKKYHDFNATQIIERSEQVIIDELEERFRYALTLEYQKYKVYGHKHLATLSGGLDSRMNVCIAHKLGFQLSNLCFSQSNYTDEKIARSIAKDLGQAFYFVPLDGGKYVFDFEENMAVFEGQIFYPTSAHFNFSIKKIDLAPFGLIHTGLLGDGILGTHITKAQTGPPDLQAKLISKRLYPKIENEMQALAKDYPSEDIFNLHQRFFNIIVSGAWAMERFRYLVSPFMHPDFLNLCLQIPPRYKYRQRIYLKWINRYHSDMTKYVWESSGMKPKINWQQNFSPYLKKAIALWYRARGKGHRLNMTPYQYWYKNDPKMQQFMLSIFKDHIPLLEGDTELQEDATRLFNEGNSIEKTLVMTLLGAIKRLKIRI